MYDGMGTECEVLEFLSALVVMTKPKVVIETGTYKGFGAMAIAIGMQRNGIGHLDTAEPDIIAADQARRLLVEYMVQDLVTIHRTTGDQMIRNFSRKVDLAFLDSNLDTRYAEMQELMPILHDGSIIAVHDTSTFHDKNGGPRTPFLDLAEALGFQAFNFDTPRGLMLLRKAPKK